MLSFFMAVLPLAAALQEEDLGLLPFLKPRGSVGICGGVVPRVDCELRKNKEVLAVFTASSDGKQYSTNETTL